jgi:prophage DNA circulation protein
VLENTLEQSGEGALVHPWYGDVDCVVEDFTTSFSSTEGRYAVVDILFKRFTAQDLTIIGPSSFDNLATKKENFLDKLNDALETAYDIASTPATLVTDLAAIADLGLDVVDNAKRVTGTVDEFKLAVSTLRCKIIELQLSAAVMAQDLTQLINFGTDPGDANYSAFSLTTEGKEQYSELQTVEDINGDETLSAYPSLVYAEQPVGELGNAGAELQKHIGRAALAGRAGLVGTMTIDDINDADRIGKELNDSIKEIENDVRVTDELYEAARDLRVAIVDVLEERKLTLSTTTKVELPEFEPGNVLSFDLYGNPERDMEIAELNELLHPGFIPASRELKVRTE